MEIERPPQNHEIHVIREILPYILDGSKTIEIRTAAPRFTQIQAGDTLRFNDLPESIRRVMRIGRYDSFDELLSAEDPERIMPGMPVREILSLLNQFYDSRAQRRGILAFELGEV